MKKELKASSRHRRMAFEQLDEVAGKIIQRPSDTEHTENQPPRRSQHKKSKALTLLIAAAAAH